MLEPSLATRFLISGRLRSGKSTFINFLAAIFGNLLLAFDVRGRNQFDRFAWVGKRILVLNDVNQIKPSLSELLKQLSGRDRMKYDIKNKQFNKDFVFEGIILMVSNHSADTLFPPLMDLALYDRVIEIKFDYVPKNRKNQITESIFC
jgi:phage/plasmid-associated DNA primase